ncbi:hypothetical protein VB711_14755 [Cronbergia sp. UHCC 0137]|uniref:hypothetical protein n=1 Tax=Cronbergia sp. UHCC 0137 TaxID=3110239 RepID=UPI002B1EEC59|nr:hypothetical protein [Cronbergia sp. UHCC 0137]MEA5619087.1 hypothetical protein [Cronbergia sp. UHCC 0137]
MRVWLVFFFVLFALAQFFNWVKQVSLPLPVYILGGAFLAVASNYDKVIPGYSSQTTNLTSPEILQLEQSTQSNPIAFDVINSVEEVHKLESEYSNTQEQKGVKSQNHS